MVELATSRRRLWARRVTLSAVVLILLGGGAWFAVRLWARSHVQPLLDEVWRRAEEGRVIVTAIEKYRADTGRYPTDSLDELYPNYVDRPAPAYWFFVDEGGYVSLSSHFSFIEWSLDFDFLTGQWTLNGKPLEEIPKNVPLFPWR